METTLNDGDEILNSKVEDLHPVKLVKEILDNQEILSKRKGNEESKIIEKWSYTLGSPEVVNRLIDVSNRLSSVIENKENILETLRNPIAENSIPWTKERQSDLVNSFTYLVSIKCYKSHFFPRLLSPVSILQNKLSNFHFRNVYQKLKYLIIRMPIG